MEYNWKDICRRLTDRLFIPCRPVAVQYSERREDLEAIEKIRIPTKTYPPCVVINQAAQFGWTAACVPEHIHANYCRGIHGMFQRDERWYSGKIFEGAWFDDVEQARAHHAALSCMPAKYAGMAATPLLSGRLPNPDVCILYLNPAQAFLLLSAYQFDHYEKLNFTFVGESTCSDSWVATILTGKPKLSLPCAADQKFASVSANYVLVSMKPYDLVNAIESLDKLYKNGLRYPMASHSLTTDIIPGLPKHYLEY